MEYLVCLRSELEERKVHLTEIGSLTIGVILLKEGIYAFENRCPHMEGPVCLGDVRGKVKTKLNENMESCGEYESQDEVNIVCPWHGLEFDITTGKCVPAPELELTRFETFVKDESVYVKI